MRSKANTTRAQLSQYLAIGPLVSIQIQTQASQLFLSVRVPVCSLARVDRVQDGRGPTYREKSTWTMHTQTDLFPIIYGPSYSCLNCID